jgi:dTDP-4-dehydrorhamnose 3,5-epimerase
VKFIETSLKGAHVVELEPAHDDRGFFARAFCAAEFEARGLDGRCAQSNVCLNHARGTIRGMHLQLPPVAEAKLVRCIRGSLLDVIVDLRPDSGTFLGHYSVTLSRDNRRSLYVPPMFAHGYQVLEDDTELYYQMSEPYTPGFERGFRFDDPQIGIQWPLPVSVISVKDASLDGVDESFLAELRTMAGRT